MQITADMLVSATEVITIPTMSWKHFEGKLNQLQRAYTELEERKAGLFLPPMLFRGHASASWKLDTTLERYPVKVTNLNEYYEAVFRARHEIESASGRAWELPPPHEFSDAASKNAERGLINLPGYEYFVYLRHHGFPSPLLDWTRSPYVAAFFAFSGATQNSGKVAIYAYLNSTGTKVGSIGAATIHPMGPYVRTHRRHYVQQAEYTVCAAFNESQWKFAPHGSVTGQMEGQDIVVKFTIPVSGRTDVLKLLDGFNLNAYSLFGSEDALMSTMALRQFEFSGQRRQRELGTAHRRRMALAAALQRASSDPSDK